MRFGFSADVLVLIFSHKIASIDGKTNKICKLSTYERKLENMCVHVDGAAVKKFCSYFLVEIEIVTKHCVKSHFLLGQYWVCKIKIVC